MSSSNSHLVVLDFPGIKGFVFGTDRLVEIRGASALLDYLNREFIPNLILKEYGKTKSRCVFAGGGAGQFIIEHEPQKIREFFHQLQGEVYQRSGGGLRIEMGISSLGDDYRKALERAFNDLEKRRRAPCPPFHGIHNGFMRDCDSCSGMASEMTEYGDVPRLLCHSCAIKEKTGKELGLWKKLSQSFKDCGIDREELWKRRPKDFTEIGDRCEARRGYTALIYGDGNAMGRLVKQIGSEAQFRRFSKAVDDAVSEACHEALWRHCQPVKDKMPVDILLLGGDDVMVYLAADLAMPFAVDVARLFEEKTRAKLLGKPEDAFFKKTLGNMGLTLSIGIAYGRSHTPIAIMVDQAEELLKSAKKRGVSKDNYTPAYIDFHQTSRFNQKRVSDTRKQHLTLKTSHGGEITLYQGPYSLEECEALMEHAGNLRRSKLPKSRLHRLSDAPFQGKVNGTIETLTIYGRCKTSEQKQALWKALDRFDCLQVMPWKQDKNGLSTILPDLMDIAELTPQK